MANPENTPVARSKGGKFAPGASGNPGGRKPIDPDLRRAAQEYTELALTTLARICEQGDSDSARVTAACALLDRAHGKPVQALDVTTRDDGQDQVRATLERMQASPLTAAALLTLAEASARAD